MDSSNVFFEGNHKFVIIDRKKWSQYEERGSINGFPINWIKDTVLKMLDFTEKHDEFLVAFTTVIIGQIRQYFVPMMFYRSQVGLIRVALEFSDCHNCGWNGIIANPKAHHLYEMTDLKHAYSPTECLVPRINCPICNSKLERYAIWAGER